VVLIAAFANFEVVYLLISEICQLGLAALFTGHLIENIIKSMFMLRCGEKLLDMLRCSVY
jgi:hypothetical protein